MTAHPAAYIESWKRDFDDAFSRDTWFSGRDEKAFAKAMRSTEPLSGYSALLIARRRSTFLCYEGQRRVLEGDRSGWNYIDRAYDNIWWAFRARPYSYGDYESLIQLMLPFSDLIGYHERARFIGQYLYERRDGDGADRYLEHSNVGRFVVQLWARSERLPLDRLGRFSEFSNRLSGYRELVDQLHEPLSDALEDAVRRSLDYHLESAANEEGEFRTGILFHLTPVEVLYFSELRRRQGLPTPNVDHLLWSTNLSSIPKREGFVGALADPVLDQAISKVVRQGLLTNEDVLAYRQLAG